MGDSAMTALFRIEHAQYRLILTVLAAGFASWPTTSVAVSLDVQENVAYFGTLDQHSLEYSYPGLGSGNGDVACGPAAATNSLVYLQNAYPGVYGNALIASAGHDMDNDGHYTSYDNLIYTAGGILASPTYMNTTLANGTWHDKLHLGSAQLHRKAQCQARTTYAAQDYWSPTYWGNVPATNPPPSWVSRAQRRLPVSFMPS